MTTGQKIAQCRKEKGLTQKELAAELGVTRQAVSRWESDLAFPETDTFVKMSKLFGVTLDYLVNYDADGCGAGGEPCAAVGAKPLNLKNFYIEYVSKTHIGSLPLVHINIGLGRTAKGVFALGIKSVGVFSVGILSLGAVSVGTLGLGLVSFSCLSLALLAFGAVALGIMAWGAIAVGLFAGGAVALGLFSVGAYANGVYFAVGDVAHSALGVAVGKSTADGKISVLTSEIKAMQPKIEEFLHDLPAIWRGFSDICERIVNAISSGKLLN